MNVLVLCTGNSCRSILAEVLFNDLGGERVRAFSAGSQPAGAVNPGALAKLVAEGHSVGGLSSKSWEHFSGPEAPEIDVVITVCENVAGESCPVWYGSPITVHWEIPDPADASPENITAAFDLTYMQLCKRISQTLELPFESMDPRSLKDGLTRIHDAACGRERMRQ